MHVPNMLISRRDFLAASTATAAASFLVGCDQKPDLTLLRVGFFPNITHAPALVGYLETKTKGAEGWFESRVGVKLQWYPFNAGPSAIEGIFTGTIDATYVGTNPPLNGYIRAKGMDIRVLTGAARGGVALVVQPGSGLKTQADFRGRKLATPQLGNTQDVAARAWLKSGGVHVTTSGGEAFVVPTANPDQLALFKNKQLDAAWTVEPWVSRLELEAGGERLLTQDDVLVTVIATGVKSLQSKRGLLEKFLAAHEELIAKITADPDWAKMTVNDALRRLTTRALPAKVLDRAWPRLKYTTELHRADFDTAMRDARSAGLLPMEADLTNLFAKL
jgi:NitT/TauT family transport system substrate-binding protein